MLILPLLQWAVNLVLPWSGFGVIMRCQPLMSHQKTYGVVSFFCCLTLGFTLGNSYTFDSMLLHPCSSLITSCTLHLHLLYVVIFMYSMFYSFFLHFVTCKINFLPIFRYAFLPLTIVEMFAWALLYQTCTPSLTIPYIHPPHATHILWHHLAKFLLS